MRRGGVGFNRLVRAALVVILFLAATSLVLPAEDWLLLTAPPGADFNAWRDEAMSRGVAFRFLFPPAGGLVAGPDLPEYATIADLVPAGTRVVTSPDDAEVENDLGATDPGRMLWHAFAAFSGREPLAPDPDAPPPPPLVDEGLPGPVERQEVACDSWALRRTTSEYMLGMVSVTVILPESVGGASTENWSVALENQVSSEVVEGLGNLSNLFPAGRLLRPTWVMTYVLGRTDTRAQVSVEPISGTHPIDTNPQWVNTIYNAMGYAAEPTMWDKGRALNGDRRALDGSDWSFTLFVANSVNNLPGMYTDNWYGYAYLGGPFAMMTYDNATWGIGRMNEVMRHETSHIFYALDEYNTSTCFCAETCGYITHANQNCDKTCPSNTTCVMRTNVAVLCPHTQGMIGWKDSNANNFPDVIEPPPETSLVPQWPNPTTSPVLTYSGTGFMTAATNQNPYHYACDMNITRIALVVWRVDGGTWQGAVPSDGGWGNSSEGFTFTTPPLAPGPHLIEAVAQDQFGRTDMASPAFEWITVLGPPPAVPSGLTGGVPVQVAKLAADGSLLQVAWDVALCAPVVQHNIIYGGGSQLPATLGGTYVTAGAMCGIGTTGVFTWLNAIDPSTDPTRFFWWLIVADDGAGTEGSWGLDSGGLERSGPGPGGSSLMCGQVTKSVGNLCGR